MPESNKEKVYLARTMQQANIAREEFFKREGKAILGSKFLTESIFIDSLWKIAGASNAEAPSLGQSYALLAKAFKRNNVEPSHSDLRQAMRLIREAGVLLGFPEYDESKLSANEASLLKTVRIYFSILQKHGLMDKSQKYFEIDPSVLEDKEYEFVFLPGASPSLCFKKFCQRNRFSYRQLEADKISKPKVDMNFAFPAGEYAKPKILLDILDKNPEYKNVLITAKDPLKLFENLKNATAQRNYEVQVNSSLPFFDTDFGKTGFALFNFLALDKDYRFDYLYGFLNSSFSGLSPQQAIEMDYQLRSNRKNKVKDFREIVYEISDMSPVFKCLCQIFEDGKFSLDAYELLHSYVSDMSKPKYYRRQQHIAIDAFYEFICAFIEERHNFKLLMKILEGIVLRFRFKSQVEDPSKQISLCSLSQASNYAKGSFDQVFVCDLNSKDYPMTQRGNSIELMLEKLGLEPEQEYQESLRHSFATALSLSSASLVLERSLNNEDSDELYPASILEELTGLYMGPDDDPDTLVMPYYLPPTLAESNIFNLGEDKLVENISQEHKILKALEKVKNSEKLDFKLPDHLSPSAIESYVDCPFKYYITRILGIEGVESQLGPLEKGSFVHKVMEEFYSKLPEAVGISKVSSERIDDCKYFLSNVFDSLLEADEDLFTLSYFEDKDIENLKQNLLSLLDYEAGFLQGMEPKYFEYGISSKDTSYAVYPVTGKIDRLDTNEEGQAAVVDYKGSVGNYYMLFEKKRAYPERLQTLIYARLAGEKLDLNSVAALYLSYGRKKNAGGAIETGIPSHVDMDLDRSSFSAEKMQAAVEELLPEDYDLAKDFQEPTCAAEIERDLLWAHCWTKTLQESKSKEDFQILLDAVELYCSYFVEFWQDADFACNPCSEDSCTYCPAAVFCEGGAK